MPEYLAPGVYIEEISVGPKPIEGVSTSTAAFIGETERGPEYAKLVTSWLEYQRWFGDHIDNVYLSRGVQGFFDNGGKRCFLARIVAADAQAAQGTIGTYSAQAIGRGTWGNNIAFKIEAPGKSVVGEDRFKLTLMYFREQTPSWPLIVDPASTKPADLTSKDRRTPDAVEVYDNVVEKRGRSNSLQTLVNSTSHLIRIWAPGNPTPTLPAPSALAPLMTTPGSNGTLPVGLDDFTGNVDPLPLINEGTQTRKRGLIAISEVDQVSLIVVPDEVNLPEIRPAVIQQCEELRDRFAVMSAAQGTVDFDATVIPQDTTFAALYLPWIKVYDARTRDEVLIPPAGHIAGIYARTDIERGVHKAPGNEIVRGATDVEFPITKGTQDLWNPIGVNCIRDFRKDRRGIRVWGARTVTSDPEWKYINVRRLFLYLEESIDEATQWVVFEPNDEPLWARVKQSIETFLVRVWRSGALMGGTEDEAFFVKCDRSTMTQDDIDNGRLICLIGVAPVKPAEFVIFRFFQRTAELAS